MSRLDSLREALAVSPDNVPLLMLFGQACVDELNFEEARRAFEQILRVEPNHNEARLGIARTAFLQGNTSEAVVRCEAVVQADPRNAEGWMLLSRLVWSEGNATQARDFFRQAVELKPSLHDASLEAEIFPGGAQPAERTETPAWSSGEEEEISTDSISGDLSEVEQPEISFREVGGMEDVKEEIRMKIIYPLQNRGLFRAYGKKMGGGVLLYGPPGCGKTLISKATAGEIKANFISVGIHQILDLYIGNSEKNLHSLFQLARDNAPSVLFFDEVDALAADRKDLRESGMRTLINQFLAEMDGNIAANEGILVLGATNAPWHLDPAFRRPGRFDRVVFVPPPDETARESIIEILAKEKPVQKLDAKALARRTKDFSGADLKAVFDMATERALSKAMKEGRVVPISAEELLQTAKSLKPSTRAWFESAKNYALYANQGGFYDDVLNFLGIRR
jgi:SpoVK/Ycf46/Vps4 family AAA+-type ATPase